MMNLTYFIITLYLVLNSISCHKNYQKRTLEDDSICSPLTRRKIALSDSADEGLIVTYNRLKEHSTDWNYDHQCKFQIRIDRDITDILTQFQRSSNIGLIATIQKLSLRQDNTTGECIDWVQFTYKKKLSQRYCGNSTYDSESGNLYYFPVKMFTDKFDTTVFDTTVFINRKRLEPNENFDLLIVYTPIKYCRDAYFPFMKCSTDEDIKAICIRNEFKNDSYFNCPNCLDEGDTCRKTKHSSGVGTIATIGAILSLIISFIFFLSCMWICKRFNLFCWSHTFAAGSNRSTQHSNVEMNLQGNIPTPNITTAPSAPPLDKDLPPPYESLFPERAGDS